MERELEIFDGAAATVRQVMAGITPDQLDLPSPCASWKVRDVLNHVIGARDFFVSAMGGTPPAAPEGGDYASGDFRQAFDEGAEAIKSTFSEPGALERTANMPWGPMPARALLGGIAATDAFTHAWDLAKATGQPTDLDPALAEELLIASKTNIQDGFRGPDGSGLPFGPEQQAPADASPADRLAAFLGRAVA
jgi:uncharacterized protein (TIGR03086 family)